MSMLLLVNCAKCCKPKKLSINIPLKVSCFFKAFIRSVTVSYSINRKRFGNIGVKDFLSENGNVSIARGPPVDLGPSGLTIEHSLYHYALQLFNSVGIFKLTLMCQWTYWICMICLELVGRECLKVLNNIILFSSFCRKYFP